MIGGVIQTHVRQGLHNGLVVDSPVRQKGQPGSLGQEQPAVKYDRVPFADRRAKAARTALLNAQSIL